MSDPFSRETLLTEAGPDEPLLGWIAGVGHRLRCRFGAAPGLLLPLPALPERATPRAEFESAEELRRLLGAVREEGTAFQSVLVALAQTVGRTLHTVGRVAACSISLAQQEKLRRMGEELDAAAGLLRSALPEAGRRLCCGPAEALEAGAELWWFALSDAIYALEERAACIESILAKQPPGSPARRLGDAVTRLLRRHQEQLLLEAERWIG